MSQRNPEADEADLVDELRALGFEVSSIYDFVNTSAPYQTAYPTLVRHLRLPHHPRIREGIIRALTVKDARKVAEAALLEGFQSESDPILRWTFANALKTVMPSRARQKYPEVDEVFAGNAAP
jgi:hypothetical protein